MSKSGVGVYVFGEQIEDDLGERPASFDSLAKGCGPGVVPTPPACPGIRALLLVGVPGSGVTDPGWDLKWVQFKGHHKGVVLDQCFHRTREARLCVSGCLEELC
jgi:hypothetical protein